MAHAVDCHVPSSINKARELLHLSWELVRDAIDEFSKDRGDLTAAGLAFFTLLSIAPLIIIAVAIAGVVLGPSVARMETQRLLINTMGAPAAEIVNAWVEQASAAGGIASIVGGLLLLWTASRFAHALKVALNQVWNVDVVMEESFKSTLGAYVRRRSFAFVLVLASGPLLLAVFITRALLIGLRGALFADSELQALVASASQFALAMFALCGVCTLIYRYVPDTRIGWRVALVGGAVTSLLFNIGNLAVGAYLGRASVGEAYGLASSLAVVLLWLYYSALIFVFGAEFTQVWASRFGRGLSPDEERDRAKVLAASKQAAASRLAGNSA